MTASLAPIGRDAFVAPRHERWTRLDHLLAAASLSAAEWSELAAGYRAVCADLSIARSLGMPSDVQDVLDDLAGRAHNRLYTVRPSGWGLALLHDAFSGFPAEVRAQWPLFLAALLLFYGPFVVGFVGASTDPTFATNVLPEEMLVEMERAYATDGVSRGPDGDAMMAGFYVFNNVGIAFRCFATGALFGLGSVYSLVYNGLMIGTVAGHLSGVGLGGNLLTFVAGHSAWELTGICVAGAAGLRLGWSLIATEGLTRAASVRRAAPAIYRLVLGAAVMLLVAAAIEGFWSAGPVGRAGKYAFGVVQVGVVTAWLVFGGRRSR